ncbi:hypothetical protein P280DRAFT_357980, partial [Massarina eburnea CBS 473.64]
AYRTEQLMSEDFVESCGAILFDLGDPKNRKVCLIRTRQDGQWHLAKGRRNHGESRHDAALREVTEETGHRCHLFPVTMATRATHPDLPAQVKDVARVYDHLTESFACQIRHIRSKTKIIWWYIAALDQAEDTEMQAGEPQWEPVFFPLVDAVHTPTYQQDREILAKAMHLVVSTL